MKYVFAPEIRKLQSKKRIDWFCFLIHEWDNLGRVGYDCAQLYIHIRLRAPDNKKLLKELPDIFQDPTLRHVKDILGVRVNEIEGADWDKAWELLGIQSEYALSLIEMHTKDLSNEEIVQYLHYTTNSLNVQGCMYLPNGAIKF